MACTEVVHGRSRKTIDPRIPDMPGRGTSFSHQQGRHCCIKGKERREVSNEWHDE